MIQTMKILVAFALFAGCGVREQFSSEKVTHVEHSEVERQAVSNCWVYAVTGWIESMHLTATGEKLDLSEAYLAYWHWFWQLRENKGELAIKEIDPNGHMDVATGIIGEYGLVAEKDFIPEDSQSEVSTSTLEAMNYVNAQLQPGWRLTHSGDMSDEEIRSILREAFGVERDEFSGSVEFAKNLVVGKGENGRDLTLNEVAIQTGEKNWVAAEYPYMNGTGTGAEPATATAEAAKVLKRMMTALNDGHPVIMVLMVDFAAVNPDTWAFDNEYFKQMVGTSSASQQGGHMAVLQDYTVTGVPPGGRSWSGVDVKGQKRFGSARESENIVCQEQLGL